MKKLLLLLFALMPLLGSAQLIDKPRAEIRSCALCPVLYTVTTDVPKGTYAGDEFGYAKFLGDVKNGLWNLTLDNGAVIAKGTKPPKIPPVPTAPAAPSWASLRYSLSSAGLLYVEGAGDQLGKLRFQRVDGTAITGTNPNGVNLTDQMFYAPGDNADVNWPKQWRATFTPSIIGQQFRITAQKSDGTLFAKEFVPVSGAEKTVLYTAGGSTTTPPSSTTTTPTTPTTTVAYNQSFESEAAQFSNSGQDVFAFDDPGSSGARSTCCFTDATRYLDYSVTGIAGSGSLSLEFQYQTNTGDAAEATVTANGTSQTLALAGLGGGKATKTVSIPVVAGTNTVRIAGKSGTFLQDKIRVYGSITTGGSGGTTTPPTGNVTTSYPSFTRIVGIGNSIWTHSASTALNWNNNNGMAASAPDKDMAHLIWAALKTVNPNVTLSIMGQGSGLELGYNSTDKDAVKNNLTNLNDNLAQQNGANATYDLILLMIGENTSDNGFDETKFRSMLDQLFASIKTNGPPTVVVRNSFWDGNSQANAVLKAYAAEKGFKFANMDDIRERTDYKASQYANGGVAHHPNDAGHAAMAERVLAQLRTSTTTTPTTPTTGPTTTTGNGQGLYALNSTYTALSESGGRPAYAMPSWITNGTMKLGITPTAGDVITHYQEGDQQSIVNNPQFAEIKDGTNTRVLDLGRQIMDAAYSYPSGSYSDGQPQEGHYTEAGQSTGQYHGATEGSIGWNPVQGGDESYKGRPHPDPNASPVLTHYVDGSKAYYKTQPMQWDMNNIKGKMYMEGWVNFDPNNARAFRFHRRWSLFRDDAFINDYQTPRRQEAPCFYTTPGLRKYYYCTGQPYTNAALTERDVTSNRNFQQIDFYSTEPFIFSVNPDNGKTMCLLAHNARFAVGRFVSQEPGWDNPIALDAGYVQSAPVMSLDYDGIYDFDAAIGYFNSLSEARAWAYAQPRWDGLPEYRFDQVGKTRMGFWLHHAQDQREKNMNGWLEVQPIKKSYFNNGLDMAVHLPEKWINGRTVKHLYLKAAISSSTNQFWISWRKAGDDTDYHKVITLPNDNVDHITDIDMSGEANWSDKDIVQCWFSHINVGQGFPPVDNDSWKIKYISYRNLN